MPKDTTSIQFTYERKLKLRLPEFKLSKNIQYLDPVKLGKGSHTIELGKFAGCACDCTVTASINKGMITGIKYPRCKNGRDIPAKLAEKMRAAHKKLTRNTRRRWHDIPVHELVNNKAVALIIDITISGGCFMICWDVGLGEQCIICCTDAIRPWCIGPSEPVLQL